MAYQPKSTGITFLRHALRHGSKKLKYVTIPMERAKEILEQSNHFQPYAGNYNLKSNSLKGAAVVLAMDAKELMERLNAPHPSQILNDLAEARNKVKQLVESGNALAIQNNQTNIRNWVHAKSL